MVGTRVGEIVRCVNLRKKNTSAVVRPSAQRKNWKRTKERHTRNLVAPSLTNRNLNAT